MNYMQNFCTKQRVLGSGTMQNVEGPTLVDMATKFGLLLHKIAYKSACMADRPEMFGAYQRVFGDGDSMEPCKLLWGRPLLPRHRNFG